MAGAAEDRAEIAPGARSRSVLTNNSSLVEKVLEYRFLGQVTAELLRRGSSFDVLRSDVDCHGHDLVIEAGGIVRHIQLKATIAGGRRANVTVSTGLAAKPSGCVIWMFYDPFTYEPVHYRWFGAEPGLPLPHLGGRLARHSKADASGLKAIRQRHRVVTVGQFASAPDVECLVSLMFGQTIAADAKIATLRAYLADRPIDPDAPKWLERVRDGDFAAMPDSLGWRDSGALAHLIDGYEVLSNIGLGDPFQFAEKQLLAAKNNGRWSGNTAELWISLFLEHRRWRFSSPFEPDEATVGLLDGLVWQLRTALVFTSSNP